MHVLWSSLNIHQWLQSYSIAFHWAPTLSLFLRTHSFLLFILLFIHPVDGSTHFFQVSKLTKTVLIRQSASVLRVTCDGMWKRWFRPMPPSEPRPPVLFYRPSGATETSRSWYHCPLGGPEPEYCWHISYTWTLKWKKIQYTVFETKWINL